MDRTLATGKALPDSPNRGSRAAARASRAVLGPIAWALLAAGCASTPPPRPAPEPGQTQIPVALRAQPESQTQPETATVQGTIPPDPAAAPPPVLPQLPPEVLSPVPGRTPAATRKPVRGDAAQALAASLQPQQPAGPDLPVVNPVLPPSDDRPRAERRALVLHLGAQRFEYLEDDRLVHAGPLSSGRPGYDTPKGHYSVGAKVKDKVSGSYDNQLGMDAWMPWAVQIGGPYWLHEGWLPGYPDSHGCVRVGEQDARFFFANLQRGDPIAVTD